MPDPENAGTDAPDAPATDELPPSGEGAAPQPGLVERGLNALGMGGGEDAAADPAAADGTDESTDEAPVLSQQEQIRRNNSSNMSAKEARKRATNAA